MKLIYFDVFFNVNVLTYPFCIKEWKLQILCLSLMRFELLGFEHGDSISHKM